MKNSSKFIIILVIAAVILAAFASCDSNGPSLVTDTPVTNGKLTITGIPAMYNGQYVWAIKDNAVPIFLIAAKDGNSKEPVLYGGKITDGTVTLKVWIGTDAHGFEGYFGSHTNINFTMLIFEKEKVKLYLNSSGDITSTNPAPIKNHDVENVNFVLGVGAGSWGPP